MRAKTLAAVLTGGAFLGAVTAADQGFASSHMDAPLITLDDPANTTDVYAFVSQSKDKTIEYLTTALAVYPFQEPGIGPNNYRFDDNVLYEIHVALGDDIAAGRATLSYQFKFDTRFLNQDTIRQAFLGEIESVFDENQNLRQSYTVTKVDHRAFGDDDDDDGGSGRKTVLATGLMVPPNNQGLLTPRYNQNDDGDMPAREGVKREANLDDYTRQASSGQIDLGYRAFAGQRDDGFYADIQSIFDLDFTFGRDFVSPAKPFDSQGGFNLHTIVLNIPLSELEGAKIAGVYATTSRRRLTKLARNFEKRDDKISGQFIQVARQGNPLFAEALVALRDKDLYNRTDPSRDRELFSQYAEDPELSPTPVLDENGVPLIVGIFVPDLIKVDLTTGPARLAGQKGFNRLGFFGADGGDVLKSEVQDPFNNGGFIPGGWPNGRRFGDDVVDIALIALGIPAPENGPADGPDYDGVTGNDITFNDVFPYAATPLNGRNHGHHGEPAATF